MNRIGLNRIRYDWREFYRIGKDWMLLDMFGLDRNV